MPKIKNISSKHLGYAIHNEGLIESLKISEPNNYFSWKVTLLFYTANRYIHALAEYRKVSLGSTHYDVRRAINPNYTGRSMTIKPHIYNSYINLLNYSKAARYDCIGVPAQFEEFCEENFSFGEDDLKSIKKYVLHQMKVIVFKRK